MSKSGKWSIEQLQQIVSEHQSEKVGGILVDVQSANLVCSIYGVMTEENKTHILAMPIDEVVSKLWMLMGR